MKLQYGSGKPAIHVYYCNQIENISCIKQLLFGMEEEGVPCVLEAHEDETSLGLAYKAAKDSNLGVGIGIGAEKMITLHYVKLKQEEPLFRVSLRSSKATLRTIGNNAARLVKGVPFKSVPDKEEEEKEKASENNIKYLTAVILSRIHDLLRDKGGADFV